MTEKEVAHKVHLSSSLTGFIKYFPLLIGMLMTVTLIAEEEPETAIIPIVFLLVGLSINLFIVDASVDKQNIYIKQWIKEKKYPLESLHKIGDFSLAKGWTIIDIKTNISTTRTFLIINDFNSVFADDSKDISEFLLKLKTAYSANKDQG